MAKKPKRKSVLMQLEVCIEDMLKEDPNNPTLLAIYDKVIDLVPECINEITTAFDSGRVAQRFLNTCNGKTYYQLNFHH